MQQDIDRAVGWSIHQGQYLKDQYQEWFKNYKQDRNAAIELSTYEYKDARQAIMDKYNANLTAIRANDKLTYHRKQQELALNKSQKIFDLDALQKARDKEMHSIRENYNTEMQSAYRKFLASQAMDGDEIALEELRRLRIKYDPGQDNTNSMKCVDRFTEFRLNITHEIDEHGVINYKLNDKVIIKDSGKRIDVLDHSADNIKLSLDLAIQKFGSRINLNGTEEFRKKIVDEAIKNNYRIEFLDEFSKQYHQSRLEQIQMNTEQIKGNNQTFANDIPGRYIILEISSQHTFTDSGRFNDATLYKVQNIVTGNEYVISNPGLDYLNRSGKLDFNPDDRHIYDVTHSDNGVKFNLTRESVLQKEIKTVVLAERLEAFRDEIRQKYGVDKFKAEYTGSFIKVDTDKFKREYAAIKTKNGFFQVNEPDTVAQIKQSGIKPGSHVALVIAKSEEVEKTKVKPKFTIEPATKYFEVKDLQLKVDLSLPEIPKDKQLISEGLAVVVEKQFKEYPNKDKLYYTVIKTYDGERKAFYLKQDPELGVGDLGYIRQITGRKFDIVNLNDDLAQINEAVKTQAGQPGVENLEFGKLKRIGLATIRGNGVFYAEIQTEVDGVPETIKKYGESIREQIFDNNIKPGDLIVTSITKVEEPIKVIENKLEFRQLDAALEPVIESRLELMRQRPVKHDFGIE